MSKMPNSKVLAIALGLPSSILGVSFFSLHLKEKGYITGDHSTYLILANIFVHLFWLVKYADKKSD